MNHPILLREHIIMVDSENGSRLRCSFTKLFDAKTRTALVATINQIKENAVAVVA